MPNTVPTLFLFCGKIAAGKSTLAREIARRPSTVLLSEDLWLSTLYPDEITALNDYVRCSGRLKTIIGPHVVSLLKLGISVVMDFPANTRNQRLWLHGLIEAAACDHELHFIDLPDAVCKERLRKRNETGDHNFQVSEKDFDTFTRYFEPPGEEERFNLTLHTN